MTRKGLALEGLLIPLIIIGFLAASVPGSGFEPPEIPERIPATGQEESGLPPSEITQLVLLGTGTPNAESGRFGSSLAVVVRGTPYLVDAGAGVVHRANDAFRAGLGGMEPRNLARLFLTHLHSDHTVGLPDLVYTPWVLEREEPLQIFGPSGTELMAYHLGQAYQADVQVRLEGLEPANATGYRIEARDVEPGIIYQDENVKVVAFQVAHGTWPTALGYRFETPDRVIVISGDTAPSDAIVEACGGCDILVHEVYSQAGWERRVPVWQRYHAASHTSGPALAEIATRAKPRLLVLTHQLLWGATPEELLEEVQSGFSGQVVYGRDLDVF